MRCRWKKSTAGFVLGAVLLPTGTAQSIDTSISRVTVGQPLKLQLLVRDFEPSPRTLLTGPCFQVDLRQGDAAWPPESLKWQVQPSGAEGQWRLQITSTIPVQEPMLQARIALLCGAPLVREFTLLADPPGAPDTANAAPVPAVESSGHSTQPDQAAQIATSSRRPRTSNTPSAPNTPTAPVAVARLQLDDLLSAAPPSMGAPAGMLSPRPLPAPADTALTDAFQSLWLQELQSLHEEQRQARARLAALNERLERAERNTWHHWGEIAGGIAGLLATAVLIRLLREALLKHVRSRPAATAPDRLPNVTTSRAAAWMTRSHAQQATAATLATSATSAIHGDAGLEWPAPTVRHWSPEDFGQAALDDPPYSAAMAQVDALSAGGYHGASVAALEHALQSRSGKSPWILLRLLDLYRTLNQPWNHERVSAELEAIYNVRVPPMAEGPDEGRGLEDQPRIWQRVCQIWPAPDAARQLAPLLLRPTTLEVLDLAAFRDALMLYAMRSPALNRESPPQATATLTALRVEDWALTAAVP